MPDILNSQIQQAQVPGVNVSAPNFTQPQTAGVNVDPQAEYDLKRMNLMEEMKNQTNASKLAYASKMEDRAYARPLTLEKQQQEAEQQQHLQNISQSLISKYQEIDTKITNPVEKAKYKRDADLAALVAAGDSGRTQISTIADRLKTKREVRPDGLINILGADGEIIGTEGFNKDTIIANNMHQNESHINEVFPNTLGIFADMVKTDPNLAASMDKNANDVLMRLKNEAMRFKEVSNDYHMGVNTLPSSQAGKLLDNAKSQYFQGIQNVLGIFTSPDILRSVRSGKGLNRADLNIAIQQVKRDVMDEIVTQHVPINTADVETYTNSVVDNINKLYDDLSTNDNKSLDIAEKELKLKNEIRYQYARQNLDMSQVEAAQPLVDMLTKVTAAQAQIADAQTQASISTAPGAKDMVTTLQKQAAGMQSLQEGLMPQFEMVQRHIHQSSFDLDSFKRQINKSDTPDDLVAAFNVLGRVTNHDAGWTMAPYVQKAVTEVTPKLEKLKEQGLIGEQQFNDMMSQLGQYHDYAEGIIANMGMTKEEYETNMTKGMSFWDSVKSLFSSSPTPTTVVPQRSR